MMAPYNEELEAEWVDDEPEMRKDYEQESTEYVRLPGGRLVLSWDEEFRVPGSLGFGGGSHHVPSDYERVGVPFRETYATFEEYAKDWCDQTRDELGRLGHWTNERGFWDWWVIGGRWSGHFPLKPGAEQRLGKPGTFDNKAPPNCGDVVSTDDIDLEAVAASTLRNATKFVDEYQAMLDGTRFDSFEGPRDMAMRLGLLRVERGPATAAAGEVLQSWREVVRGGDSRVDWNDVAKIIEREAFIAEYLECFNTLVTFAALDDDGWHAPGKMGWWASSTEGPDEFIRWRRGFMGRFVREAKRSDRLVLVDAHV
jgi:hypothetical protein